MKHHTTIQPNERRAQGGLRALVQPAAGPSRVRASKPKERVL